jgi:hypothetical protein
MYRGCKIYDSVQDGAFRVVPKPGESKYDRRFPYGKKLSKADAWKEVVKYCEKPFIPKSSPNYVKC